MTKSIHQQTGFVHKKEGKIHDGQHFSSWKHTEKLNPILVPDKCRSNITVGWPLFHAFKMATLFGWPMVAHNKKSMYHTININQCSSW